MVSDRIRFFLGLPPSLTFSFHHATRSAWSSNILSIAAFSIGQEKFLIGNICPLATVPYISIPPPNKLRLVIQHLVDCRLQHRPVQDNYWRPRHWLYRANLELFPCHLRGRARSVVHSAIRWPSAPAHAWSAARAEVLVAAGHTRTAAGAGAGGCWGVVKGFTGAWTPFFTELHYGSDSRSSSPALGAVPRK